MVVRQQLPRSFTGDDQKETVSNSAHVEMGGLKYQSFHCSYSNSSYYNPLQQCFSSVLEALNGDCLTTSSQGILQMRKGEQWGD